MTLLLLFLFLPSGVNNAQAPVFSVTLTEIEYQEPTFSCSLAGCRGSSSGEDKDRDSKEKEDDLPEPPARFVLGVW